MKIGFQGRFLLHPFTGIGQYSKHLLEEFTQIAQSRQHEFIVAKPEKPLTSGFKRHYFEQHTALKFFRQHRVDLMHFPYPAHPWKIQKVPTIVTVHDVIPWIFPEYRQGIFSSVTHEFAKKSLHLATHIITVSEFSKQEIMRVCGVPAEKISVIYNGYSPVYTEDFQMGRQAQTQDGHLNKLPEPLQKNNYILYVGGYDKRKNVDLLLESFRLFSKKQKNATLVLVGRPHFQTSLYSKNGLSELTFKSVGTTFEVADIGNGGRIFRTDFLDEETLAVFYRFCRFFIHLSSYEGFNIPPLEAAASGVSLLLSDIPVHREIFGDSALFTSFSDPSEVTHSMEQLWNQTDLRQNLAEKSKLQAKKYSWKQSAEQHLSVYESVCHSRPLSPSLSSSFPQSSG